MAAPNLKIPSTVIGKTVSYAVTASLDAALTNSAASNKVFKVNSVYCSNIDGAASADIDLAYYDGSTDTYMAYRIAVPIKATQILISRESYIYLQEGDSLKANASAANDLVMVISYEEIS